MIFRIPETGKTYLAINDAVDDICCRNLSCRDCFLHNKAPGDNDSGCYDYAADHYKEVATMLGLEIIHENAAKVNDLCDEDGNELAADTNVGHTEKPDMVNQPPHYTAGGIECADALDAMVSVYPDPNAAALAWQVGKYIWRHPLKWNPLEDLKKARWYLDRLIAHYEKKEASDGK